MAQDNDRAGSLDLLNASERELLLLLGRGHTAKSIAVLKGLSELAVNERFRSARRKTGIGSSREIARLLVAQESRDDFIGLAEPATPPPSLDRPDAPRRASFIERWRYPMAAAILVAAAILAQQSVVPSVPAPTGEQTLPPAVAAIFAPAPTAPDIAALHAEARAGSPETTWSQQTRTSLSQTYRDLRDVADALDFLDVTCGASLCEALGLSRPGLSGARYSALMDTLQTPDLDAAVRRQGLTVISQSFHSTSNSGTPDNPGQMAFAAYFRPVATP